MGDGVNVYLILVEFVVVGVIVGCILIVEEYMEYVSKINVMLGEVFCYLNFDKMFSFKKVEEEVKVCIILILNVV